MRTVDSAGFQGSGGTAIAADSSLIVQQTANSTYTGVISGAGSLQKTQGGTLTLTGQNTHTGGTAVHAGTIDTTGGGTLADTGAVIIDAGATFIAGTADTTATMANSGTLVVNAAQTLTHLTNASGGVVNLNANLTGDSVNNLAGGLVNQNADIVTRALGISGTFNAIGQRSISTSLLAGDSSGRLVIGGTSDKLTLNQTGNSVYAGQINGPGTFAKTGSGNLTLAGVNGSTGTLLVQAGGVEVTGSVASTGVQVSQGANLAVVRNSLSSQAALTNAGALEVRDDNTVTSFANSGTVNGSGKLTAGTYLLDNGSVVNANLGTGTLTTQGQVQLNGTSDAAIVNVAVGSQLTLGGVQRLWQQAAVAVDGRLVLGNGDQTIHNLSGAGSVNMQAYHLTVTNGGTFIGSLTSAGGSSLSTNGGNLSLSGSSAVATETLDLAGGSSLTLATGSRLETSNAVVGNGSTLQLGTASTFTYDKLSGAGVVNAAQFSNVANSTVAGSLTFSGNLLSQGKLAPGNSPGIVTVQGNYTDAGTLDLELGGVTPGTQHDQVRVTGNVTINANFG